MYKGELLNCYGSGMVCNVNMEGIARWNGTTWRNMGVGNSGGIKGYTVHNGDLYVGGGFWFMGGKQTNKIAKWNGTQWDSVGSGIHGSSVEYLNALASYKGKLYAGGVFNEIGGNTNVKCIASWDGISWQRVKDGMGGNLPEVNCMAVYKDELYVGGRFQIAGTTNAYYIARWDGVRWRSVGKGTNYTVHSMVVDTVRDVLYIGGSFDVVDDTIHCAVAQWDGIRWSATGPDIFISSVNAMDIYHGYLYAGGNGYRFDGTDTMLARWDGQTWENIPGFMGGSISSLKTYDDELYIGGNFSRIGNDTIPNLVRYYSPDTVVVGIRHEKRSPFGGDQERGLLVYPNPGGNQITIIPIAIGTELIFEKFMVKDVMGKEMFTIDYPKQNQIDIALLPSGMYYLSATTKDKEMYNATFIKE